MATNSVYLTKEGYSKFSKELNRWYSYLHKVAEKLHLAREEADLTESLEWIQAKDEYRYVTSKINEIERILGSYTRLKTPSSRRMVQLGSTVQLKCGKDERTYAIVSEYEADPNEGKISDKSPLGKGLLGRRVKDTIRIDAPQGPCDYRIVKIS